MHAGGQRYPGLVVDAGLIEFDEEWRLWCEHGALHPQSVILRGHYWGHSPKDKFVD